MRGLLGGIIISKLKFGIAASVFLAVCFYYALESVKFARLGSIVTFLVLLVFTVLFLIRIFGKKSEINEEDNDGKRSKKSFRRLLTAAIALTAVSLLVSPFISGLFPYRPVFVYKNYRSSDNSLSELFPENIPDDAKDIRFRVLGEGISGNCYYALSFSADKNTIMSYRIIAKAAASSVQKATSDDKIPADIAPDFISNNIEGCTVYTFPNEYGNTTKIFIGSDGLEICFFKE